MPPIREHDEVQSPIDDDDDMPPLVDNPIPSMTFTFATDMTPITYRSDSYGSYDLPPPPDPSTMFIMSPPSSPSLLPTRPANNNKRRDAAHIPRPPNAFILFRSSFIKAQHIPDKIEGNHSSLSKIIGMYWKTLPREERQVWEAKAVVAQAEHRQKYPDWRFRPGNVIGKVKDGPRKRSNKKGRGEAEQEEKNRQKRCAKIARLLEEGMTGTVLEDAVREYDRKVRPVADPIKNERPSTTQLAVHDARQGRQRKDKEATKSTVAEMKIREEKNACRPRAQTLTPGSPDIRFKVSLTDMFKRSSSVPATKTRNSPSDNATSFSFPYSPCVSPVTPYSYEDTLYDKQEMSPLSSPALASLPSPDFQPNTPFLTSTDVMFSIPSLDTDPVDYGSPASSTTDYVQTPILSPTTIVDDPWYIPPAVIADSLGDQPAPFLSTYSSLTGWAGEEPRYFTFESPTCSVEASMPYFQDFRHQSNATNHGLNSLHHRTHGLCHPNGTLNTERALYA